MLIPKDRNTFAFQGASLALLSEVEKHVHIENLSKILTHSKVNLLFSMGLLRVEAVLPGYKAICHPLIWNSDVFRLTGTIYRGLQELGKILNVGYIEVGIPKEKKSLLRLAKYFGFARIGTNEYNEEAWALPIRRS